MPSEQRVVLDPKLAWLRQLAVPLCVTAVPSRMVLGQLPSSVYLVAILLCQWLAMN